MPCNGNSNELCGGSWALNVYNYTSSGSPPTNPPPSSGGWVSLGCYRYVCRPFFYRKGFTNTEYLPISDTVAARTLSVPTAPLGGAANNSAESCTAACFAAGYPLAGTEYSDECCTYCPSPQQFSELVR